ncbi:MAG TPA: molybdenum cofactor biosynthesis protein MoaE [Acetobacteraceae bacterium]|jgi:molybdopterin synthase catalytic subunit|nr:molybdenum cofactor biosynthesis protein MoaE [Acetobacteraceae bacterium]
MAHVAVQEADFEPGAEIARLTEQAGGAGGIGCFIGVVRGEMGNRAITAMTLEHYPGMTERAVREIAEEAERRWDPCWVRVVHRVGRLTPGEHIVLVLVAAPHREPALAATGFLIDWLKTKAPFWKKEHFADGSTAWVEARAEDTKAAARWG